MPVLFLLRVKLDQFATNRLSIILGVNLVGLQELTVHAFQPKDVGA